MSFMLIIIINGLIGIISFCKAMPGNQTCPDIKKSALRKQTLIFHFYYSSVYISSEHCIIFSILHLMIFINFKIDFYYM